MHHSTLIHRPASPEVESLAAEHGCTPESVLEVLQALQRRHGFLDREAIRDVARALKVPAERVSGVATFYTMLAARPAADIAVLRVCDGPACWLRGARGLLDGAVDGWHLERNSCLGLCDRAPAALADLRQCGPLEEGGPADPASAGSHPDYSNPLPGETRVLLAGIGTMDRHSIDSALEHGVYRALERVLGESWAPGRVIEEVERAGHTGRGGAGFPTGLKWKFVAGEERTPKYVVCNADESEPLVFKDRVLMERNPHQLIEGMALAAYAVGAAEGYIYIRGEYEPQARVLERAMEEATERGFLGLGVLGSGFDFRLHLHRGAGAYICGEETALLESLEGKRGAPRHRPPYPTANGLHGLPTVVNNVETLAAVPWIVREGGAAYRALSDAGTPGTKLYTLLGHVRRPGLFEAPFGLTLREVIEDFGGGMREGSRFRFALTGGAAGTIVPESLLDVPMDYASHERGVSLGAGAFLVCDESVSVPALLRELLFFFEVESCGKCTPCRVGTRQARRILERLDAGAADAADLERLRTLAGVFATSLCGLGQSAAWPLESAWKHFPEAFAPVGEVPS